MESKKRIGIITLGIITFIASIIGGIIMIYIFIDEFNNYRNNEVLLISFGSILLSIIVGLYVKLTNFGILNESELQKNIYEKKKLKEQIEIAELKKKLKELTELKTS
ncbi:hypothetical protein HCG49_08290 [Arenibacter sp. 6A1]|uniref:hypothetical protein n=1 Tax=Arenibacter sp. 6A1 TaxID=2720391 RepID=UPI001445A2A4|nr:hypothetical protein [Arenibacter sp. 6A1]NKI26560.1 hypothetical protein [Arenibacter sp. 6A1]